MNVETDKTSNRLDPLRKEGVVNPRVFSEEVENSQMEQDSNSLTQLMEEISDIGNLKQSLKRVIRNKGCPGVDGESIETLKKWTEEDLSLLQRELRDGTYEPQALRRVEISKPKGGKRLLGIPTLRDRVVQQAIVQVLSPLYDPYFSDNSYGYRPKRSTHQAISKAQGFVREGKFHVVSLDIEKFFDSVNQNRLMGVLGQRIKDKSLLVLIRKFLRRGSLSDGLVSQGQKGVPQGGPLSPLLSNIYLDSLDQELEARGHSFVRYADDVRIYCRSRKAAQRILRSLTVWIKGKLKLTVNQDKSEIGISGNIEFLGYFIRAKSLYVPKDKIHAFKRKIISLTKRRNPNPLKTTIKALNALIRGWTQYYGLAQLKRKSQDLDGWLRRRLRCQCLQKLKNFTTRVRFLISRGVNRKSACKQCKTGQGLWPMSGRPGMNHAFNMAWFHFRGLLSMSQFYEDLQSQTREYRTPIP